MNELTPMEKKARLRAAAQAQGWEAFGVAPIDRPLRADYLRQWLAEGKQGDMSWLASSLERRLQPRMVLPEARCLIVLGMNYWHPAPDRRGRLARYALGADYHHLLLRRLKALCSLLRTWGGIQKPYVDTGPILEKAWAAQAGLGWQGKHTNLIHPRLGNWLFIGTILTTMDLPPEQEAKDRCGSCTRCLTACPTGAIVAPYQLDARLCISYLTIEHRGPIPRELRRCIGDHLYGCDDCLEVCPWNRWAQRSREERFAARPLPDLRDMLAWTDEDFRLALSGTPIKRIGLVRWLRNVCVVLGNSGNEADLPALSQAAAHSDPLVAEHATWAIEEIQRRFQGSAPRKEE